MEFRIERDVLGEVKVPRKAYFGAQTQRAVENFQVSGLRLQPSFVRAQAIIKRSAALANMNSGRMEKTVGQAIVRAAEEIIDGGLADQFVVDVFQAGAGTSQNMNMNEVIANRAIELLDGSLGDYSLVHPNDHVNMSQSTNDTFHTSIHIAAYIETKERLLPAVENLRKALRQKAVEFDSVVKAGRTHLQDAVPIRLGQEFGAYATMMRLGYQRIKQAAEGLSELCLGGTAVGTGLNTHPSFKKNVIASINKTTGYHFKVAKDTFEAMQSLDAIVELTGALRVLVTSLKKIADDLRLLSSGPRTGLAEIKLPAVQPGSSIMPGKINPVMAEMLNMVCFQAMGCDTVIVQAAQGGQLELNVMMPVVAYNLLLQIEILINGIDSFTIRCVGDITANVEICRKYAEHSVALATALSPYIGYERAAELARESLAKKIPLRELVLSKKIMARKKLDKLLDVRKMTEEPEISSAEDIKSQ